MISFQFFIPIFIPLLPTLSPLYLVAFICVTVIPVMMRTLPTLAFLLLSAIGIAQPTLNFTPLSLSGPTLVQPLFMSGCGDGSGRLFVVEKRGTIRIIQNNVVSTDFFLDIQDLVMNSGERGLLWLAFHPQ